MIRSVRFAACAGIPSSPALAGSVLALLAALAPIEARAHGPSGPAPQIVQTTREAVAKLSPAGTRILIGAADSGTVLIVDALSGQTWSELDFDAPARFTPSGDGRHVFAAVTDRNLVHVIDAETARETASPLAVNQPGHIAVSGDRVVLFGEGDATITMTSADGSADPQALAVDRPHRGYGVPLPGGQLLASLGAGVPVDGDPSQFVVLKDGQVSNQSPPCEQAGGLAQVGALVVVSCQRGLLFADPRTALPFQQVSYQGLAEGARLGRLVAGPGFLGVVGISRGGLASYDAATNRFAVTAVPGRVVALTADPNFGGRAYAVSSTGQVILADLTQGTLVAEAKRVTPLADNAAPGAGGDAPLDEDPMSPQLAAIEDIVVVTDPAAQRVLVLDGRSLTIRQEIKLPIRPGSLALVSRRQAEIHRIARPPAPEDEPHEEGEDHDEDDDRGQHGDEAAPGQPSATTPAR